MSRPHLERLEDRMVPSADWFSSHLPSATVASLARSDWNNHGFIGYGDMVGIFNRVGRDGVVSSSEYRGLQSLVNDARALRMPDYVRFLSAQVVFHDAANATYQGYSLGDLHAGSSGNQLAGLVDKWFFGMDHPGLTDNSLAYSPLRGSLFGRGGPRYGEVAQGGQGDCVLMSSLAEVAANDTGVIRHLFISNGNGTWTVRFYRNGSPVYVTVDNQLPVDGYGSTYYDHPQNGVLWVALAEKAYGELNAFDADQNGVTEDPWDNSYQALNGLDAQQVLTTLTGQDASYAGDASSIGDALNYGSLIVLGSQVDSFNANIVTDHAYAVLSYDSSRDMYLLFNPWGFDACRQNGVWCTFYCSADYLETYFTQGGAYLESAPAGHAAPTGTSDTTPAAFLSAGERRGVSPPVQAGPLASLNRPVVADAVFAPGGTPAQHFSTLPAAHHDSPVQDDVFAQADLTRW